MERLIVNVVADCVIVIGPPPPPRPPPPPMAPIPVVSRVQVPEKFGAWAESVAAPSITAAAARVTTRRMDQAPGKGVRLGAANNKGQPSSYGALRQPATLIRLAPGSSWNGTPLGTQHRRRAKISVRQGHRRPSRGSG